MTILRTALSELIGMFIDDGALALFMLVLIAAVAAAVKLAGLQPLAGGILLLAGSVVVLAESLHRAARRARR